MTIGKFPSWSMVDLDGTTKHFFRHPENDMRELEILEKSDDISDQHFAGIRRRLLGYKKYEREIRKYLGKRDYCKYCYGKHFYDIDWFDGVIDCRNCGYHIESIEMILEVLRSDGMVPAEPESEPVNREFRK